jgi:3-phenylpropionate/cinnamic acid dioxygenase small subunit
MERVTHPNAWSQAPLWATNHVIGNVVLESDRGEEIAVRSRFHMMELRRDDIRHFGGTYRHLLVRTADGLRIRRQRVDLFNAQAPFDYVLQVWV